MAIKESSDELNPTEATATARCSRCRARAFFEGLSCFDDCKRVAWVIPHSHRVRWVHWSSGYLFLLHSLTYWLLRLFTPPNSFARFSSWYVFLAIELWVITAVTLVGIWAASRTEKLAGRKDPGKVVIDEVAGQMIALLPVVPGLDPGWIAITSAFLLFRLFDIIKPYPARRLESLEAGLGIMADDSCCGCLRSCGGLAYRSNSLALLRREDARTKRASRQKRNSRSVSQKPPAKRHLKISRRVKSFPNRIPAQAISQ